MTRADDLSLLDDLYRQLGVTPPGAPQAPPQGAPPSPQPTPEPDRAQA